MRRIKLPEYFSFKEKTRVRSKQDEKGVETEKQSRYLEQKEGKEDERRKDRFGTLEHLIENYPEAEKRIRIEDVVMGQRAKG